MATTHTHRAERPHLHPVPTCPVVATEEAADPHTLPYPALLLEEWHLRRQFLGGRRPGSAAIRRLCAVEAALRRGGAR